MAPVPHLAAHPWPQGSGPGPGASPGPLQEDPGDQEQWRHLAPAQGAGVTPSPLVADAPSPPLVADAPSPLVADAPSPPLVAVPPSPLLVAVPTPPLMKPRLSPLARTSPAGQLLPLQGAQSMVAPTVGGTPAHPCSLPLPGVLFPPLAPPLPPPAASPRCSPLPKSPVAHARTAAILQTWK